MKLSQLFQDIPARKSAGAMDIGIAGIANNSREVKPGYLFFAIKGNNLDGYNFIEEALARGAVAIVTDRECICRKSAAIILVDSPASVLSSVSARFYNEPASKMTIIGITGTNGKTTVSYLVRSILEKAGVKTGMLGTIEYVVGERRIPSALTTPDILSINQYLKQMHDAGCKACVMEVSSHALEQNRPAGISFNTAIFTNLGRDHLDYHKSINSYLAAKKKLFSMLKEDKWAIVNMDDPNAAAIIESTKARVFGYGIRSGLRIAECGLRNAEWGLRNAVKAKGIRHRQDCTEFSVSFPDSGGDFMARTKLIGLHNVYNILAAVSTGLCHGIPLSAIKEGITSVENIPGRLERIDRGQPFGVFVDFAHTSDALENVLTSCRRITDGRLITVFGCGGNRDREKRPLMGRVASQYADYAIITSDNPRNEEPEDIIRDIEKGFSNSNYKIIQDRREAIMYAINIASPTDAIIIAGKGHENYQIQKSTMVPFNDKHVVEECLSQYADSIS